MSSTINSTWAAKTIKGAANNHRVRMLLLLSETPDLSVTEFAEKLNINFRTASEHTKKLTNTGLIKKSYNYHSVTHRLTRLGEKMLIAIEELNS
ncbi:MAG TPA: MarR family transcriptional regulator [Candidatus Saccharimonadales bacterium]|jgi:predicted transcriptional regulator